MGIPDTMIHAAGPDNPAVRYRAVCREAVVSLIAGLLTPLMAFGWWLWFVPAAGLLLGWWAVTKIATRPDELTGRELARYGMALSAGFGLLAGVWLCFVRASEVPPGYTRIEYAQMQPDLNVAGQRVPPEMLLLDREHGKKVFLKGYMVPGRQVSRLKTFRICPTKGDCNFCTPNPRPTEIVEVRLAGTDTFDYTTHVVGVGGWLEVDPTNPFGRPYSIEADYVRQVGR